PGQESENRDETSEEKASGEPAIVPVSRPFGIDGHLDRSEDVARGHPTVQHVEVLRHLRAGSDEPDAHRETCNGHDEEQNDQELDEQLPHQIAGCTHVSSEKLLQSSRACRTESTPLTPSCRGPEFPPFRGTSSNPP